MPGPRLARAIALRDDLRDLLRAPGTDDVHVTLDATEAPSHTRAGVIIISAPKLTFSGAFGDVQAAYELHVAAGPADDYLTAWDTIDGIIQALVAGNVNLRDGEPSSLDLMYGEALPCYTLTLNDLD